MLILERALNGDLLPASPRLAASPVPPVHGQSARGRAPLSARRLNASRHDSAVPQPAGALRAAAHEGTALTVLDELAAGDSPTPSSSSTHQAENLDHLSGLPSEGVSELGDIPFTRAASHQERNRVTTLAIEPGRPRRSATKNDKRPCSAGVRAGDRRGPPGAAAASRVGSGILACRLVDDVRHELWTERRRSRLLEEERSEVMAEQAQLRQAYQKLEAEAALVRFQKETMEAQVEELHAELVRERAAASRRSSQDHELLQGLLQGPGHEEHSEYMALQRLAQKLSMLEPCAEEAREWQSEARRAVQERDEARAEHAAAEQLLDAERRARSAAEEGRRSAEHGRDQLFHEYMGAWRSDGGRSAASEFPSHAAADLDGPLG